MFEGALQKKEFIELVLRDGSEDPLGQTNPGIAAAEVVAHPLCALSEHLKGMLRAERHHGEDSINLLVAQSFVEQVAHRVDKDSARPLPTQWYF